MWSTGMVRETLDLSGVEIHRRHAIRARELQHVGDETMRRSALARLGLPILSCR